MWLANLKISSKLGWGFGLIILAFAGVVGYAWTSINNFADEWHDFNSNAALGLTLSSDMSKSAGDAVHMFKNYVMRGGDYDQQFSKSLDEIDLLIAKSRARNIGPAEVEQLRLLSLAVAGYRDEMKNLRQMKAAGVADLGQQDRAFRNASTPLVEPIAKFRKINLDAKVKKTVAIDQLVQSAKELLIGVTIPVVLLIAVFGLVLSRSITRPLQQAVGLARRVAAGDLSGAVEAHRRDEAGEMMQSLQEMNRSLTRIVSQVREGTDAIAAASREIVGGSGHLAQRTEAQASSLEQTSASIEELTITVGQNADNAKLASQLATDASRIATKGGEVVSRVVATMGSISQSSSKIVDIISVIDGIAFQTNILALNAAVEAARAGEQGRGFAVVASEVRSLAQRSAAAAKEIKSLIGDSAAKVESGTKLVGEAGQTMNEIVVGIQQVTQIMEEIAAASQEQRSGIEQVNQAVTQMDRMTQQNAALVEESAAAAESLEGLASSLAEAVSVFKLDAESTPAEEHGPRAEPEPHRADPAPAQAPHVATLAATMPRAYLGRAQ